MDAQPPLEPSRVVTTARERVVETGSRVSTTHPRRIGEQCFLTP